MNLEQNMIIVKGHIKTSEIISCEFNATNNKYKITYDNKKTYNYNAHNVIWMTNPTKLNPSEYSIILDGHRFDKISAIYLFTSANQQYIHFRCENGYATSCNISKLTLEKNCLNDKTAEREFQYLNRVADIVSLSAEDGTKILSQHYKKIDFVGEKTTLATYLNPEAFSAAKENINTNPIIFPFGCNSSQFKAVKNALENQISIIKGPPGTGKTQTILNIIANLVISNQTVQIVSNNNSATANVLEKLQKENLDFIAAFLGNSDNKKEFIKNQTGLYPDLSQWYDDNKNYSEIKNQINNIANELQNIFNEQIDLATLKQKIQSVKTEEKYFLQYIKDKNIETFNIKIRKRTKSSTLLSLWIKCEFLAERGKKISFIDCIKSWLIDGIANPDFYKNDLLTIIHSLQRTYYMKSIAEILSQIEKIENHLAQVNADELTKQLNNLSMDYFKYRLYKRYGNKNNRDKFTEDSLYQHYEKIQKEYPVILSTTYSSRSSLCANAQFDYVIMDESSQVDVATGALALSYAKNAVIVGDEKQLPNIVPSKIKTSLNIEFDKASIDKGYNFVDNSFLQSIYSIMPNTPVTLLREHYRCHPKIIEFCNQKFYNGELVAITLDNGEKDVISIIKTVKGNHAADHVNYRQIKAITKEILPNINVPPSDIGIIAPYNNQIRALKKAINEPNIDISTVHKFQGREKDVIILSTVDNKPNEFTDDPKLMNVAISRAKKQLYLVVSGNEQPKNSIIYDLISYIEYNNFSVTDSKIRSIFDYLYSQYTEERIKYLKEHEKDFIRYEKKYKKRIDYVSEKLMYPVICDIMKENQYSNLTAEGHYPLKLLIKDTSQFEGRKLEYALNPWTHIDFLIYNRITKQPVLAIEVDGYAFHKDGTKQSERDKLKNEILCDLEIPYIRFSTKGNNEKEILKNTLQKILAQ